MLLDSGKPSGKNMLYCLVTLSLADSRAFSEFSSLLSTHTSTVYGLSQRDRSL